MFGRAPVLAIAATLLALGAAAAGNGELPRIGMAPPFTLMTQDGRPLALADLRGKVVVLDFIFTSCTDTCPLQTRKLARLQPALGPETYFVSITLDPQRDTPAALRAYAVRHGADLGHWAFLTGDPAQIRAVARSYGVIADRAGPAGLTHNPLTSVIDRTGTLRVQYLGARYDPAELRADIRTLLQPRAQP
jgi:protein SCO1/2